MKTIKEVLANLWLEGYKSEGYVEDHDASNKHTVIPKALADIRALLPERKEDTGFVYDETYMRNKGFNACLSEILNKLEG